MPATPRLAQSCGLPKLGVRLLLRLTQLHGTPDPELGVHLVLGLTQLHSVPDPELGVHVVLRLTQLHEHSALPRASAPAWHGCF
ncbi:unnamed protein product [Merluccius merluccius]